MKKLRFTNFSIGFKELKNETSLLITVSNCGGNCPGCHSPELRNNIGEPFVELYNIVKRYKDSITAICFLGHGDSDLIDEFTDFLIAFKFRYPELKLGVYSGFNNLIPNFLPYVDYYKIGEYVEELGGLESPTTNQIMYRIKESSIDDIINFYEEY